LFAPVTPNVPGSPNPPSSVFPPGVYSLPFSLTLTWSIDRFGRNGMSRYAPVKVPLKSNVIDS